MGRGNFSQAHMLLTQAIDFKPFGGVHILYKNGKNVDAKLQMRTDYEPQLGLNDARFWTVTEQEWCSVFGQQLDKSGARFGQQMGKSGARFSDINWTRVVLGLDGRWARVVLGFRTTTGQEWCSVWTDTEAKVDQKLCFKNCWNFREKKNKIVHEICRVLV